MELDEVLQELKRELEALYGDRLKGVYLFGSHARGDAEPDSDVDVAVVLDEYDSVWEEMRRMSQIGSRIALEAGVMLAETPIRAAEWTDQQSLFLRTYGAMRRPYSDRGCASGAQEITEHTESSKTAYQR
jgi:predicted nucleotidyltransferase